MRLGVLANVGFTTVLERLGDAIGHLRAPKRDYENDCPQPQVRWALGLLIVNPAPWRPSL
jgi:hypothetical protein